MNTVYGNFSLKMVLPQNDEDGELIANAVAERLTTIENILKATAGIEIDLQWEEIN